MDHKRREDAPIGVRGHREVIGKGDRVFCRKCGIQVGEGKVVWRYNKAGRFPIRAIDVSLGSVTKSESKKKRQVVIVLMHWIGSRLVGFTGKWADPVVPGYGVERHVQGRDLAPEKPSC